MKRKEFLTQIRSMSYEELSEKLRLLRKELFELNTQKLMGKVDKPHRFKEVKKNIARILTVMSSRKDKK